jgi:hypothetical protein
LIISSLIAAASFPALIDPAHAQTGSIAGAVRLTNCGADAADVTVTTGAKTVSMERDPNGQAVFRYRISRLAKGQHRVTPHLADGTCAGGAWNPASRTVRLNAGKSVTGQDFEYRVPLRSKRISAALVTSLIEGVFRGSVLHLNNYGPRHQQTWHKADDSFIRLGADAGGSELWFDIAEIPGASGRRYYVSELNLSRLVVGPDKDGIKLLLDLEPRGAEVKGRCADDLDCFAAADDAAPDFAVTNARLELRLIPGPDPAGGLAYGPVRAAFFMTVDGRGLGELSAGLIERQIKPAVEAAARRALDQVTVHDRVAAALRPTLQAMQIASVAGAHIEGEDLVIEYSAQ